ncbi:MAG: universal stress protein [Planctomycetes bacterium]|nr:universal stress protein [Planctomycetota bacterium]
MFPSRMMLCVGALPDFDAVKHEVAWLARQFHAALIIYHARFPRWRDLELLREERADEEALALESILEDPTLRALEVEIECGDPPLNLVDEIMAEAERRDVDLLVMPTHKRQGLDRLVLGSLTERAIRSCRLPVVALDLAGLRGGGDDPQVDRVVVPVDFSRPAEAAAGFALIVAEKLGCPMTLLYVVEEHFVPGGPEPTLADIAGVKPQVVDEFRADLDRMIHRISGTSSVEVTGQVVVGRLLDGVRQSLQGADNPLVVMATAGRDSIGDHVLGSRAERILRSIPGSILTLPAGFLAAKTSGGGLRA